MSGDKYRAVIEAGLLLELSCHGRGRVVENIGNKVGSSVAQASSVYSQGNFDGR